MRIINTVILAIILAACSSPGDVRDGKLRFGVSDCYKLSPDEQVVVLNDSLEKMYQPFSMVGNRQVPINRIVQSENHILFIGLAVDLTKEQVINQHARMKELKEDSSPRYFLSNDTIFNARWVKKLDENVFLFNWISKDSSAVKELFDQKDLVDERTDCEF